MPARFMKWLLLTAAVLGLLARAETLQVLTDENFPPFIYVEDGQPKGLYADLVREIQHRVGSKAPITIRPWARAYQTALTEPGVVLLGTARTPPRETQFQWVGPVATQVTAFYSKRGAGIRLASVENAKTLRGILVPLGWYTRDMLLKLGFTNVETAATPEHMVRMLLNDRAPLMFAATRNVPQLLAEVGANPNDVEQVLIVTRSQAYFAVSRGTPETVVHAWQQALDDIKRDGSFAVLYTKWLPGEQPPGIKPEPYVGPDS